MSFVFLRTFSLFTSLDGLYDRGELFRADAKKSKKRKKSAKATLSFALDDEGDEDSGELNGESTEANDSGADFPVSKRSRLKKNPNVDTSFLPDREREEAERKERERLRVEWLAKQEALKKEEIEIVYSYWDGSGHRKSVMVSITSILSSTNRDQPLFSVQEG